MLAYASDIGTRLFIIHGAFDLQLVRGFSLHT